IFPRLTTSYRQDGDFESGSLAPWTNNPLRQLRSAVSQPRCKGPGFGGSKHAFIANNKNANSYVELDLEQSFTVCPAYTTDPGDQPSKKNKRQVNPNKQVYVYAYVDDVFIEGNLNSDPAGPLIVWRTFTGTFTASSNQARLKVAFVATDFLGVEWGVVTPV
ncbi:MAG: hypothetical protein L6R42_006867, partial [Xanthoria sp. 1 TBL-2021]